VKLLTQLLICAACSELLSLALCELASTITAVQLKIVFGCFCTGILGSTKNDGVRSGGVDRHGPGRRGRDGAQITRGQKRRFERSSLQTGNTCLVYSVFSNRFVWCCLYWSRII